MQQTSEQQQVDRFAAIRGKRGAHYDLAREVEALGLVVQIDEDTAGDESISYVLLPGVFAPDGSDVQLGRIVGDAEAVIE